MWLKNWFALIFALGATANVIIIDTQCCIFINESLNFKTAKLLKLGMNYSWYHMAQHNAEPDTSNKPSLNQGHCG